MTPTCPSPPHDHDPHMAIPSTCPWPTPAGRLKVWPCPSAEVLAPCTCYADNFLNLFLDCQSLPDLATLTAVFNNSFPFKKFARLQVRFFFLYCSIFLHFVECL